MKNKQLLLLSMSFLLISGCSAGASQGAPNRTQGQAPGAMGRAQQTVAVEVEKVKKGNLTVTKKIIGDVISDGVSEVTPDISGELLALFVKKGDVIKQGQLLAKVDTSDTQEAILQAQIGVESAKQQLQSSVISHKQSEQDQAKLTQQKLNWDEAKKNLQETQYLYDKGAVSLNELQQAKKQEEQARLSYGTDAASSEIAIEKAQLSVDQAKLNVKKAEVTLREVQKESKDSAEKGEVRAPISGEVTAVQYKAGEKVSPQQPLLTISNYENLKVAAQVTADQKSLLPKGQVIQVVTSHQDRKLQAKVDYASGKANENGLYDVELSFTSTQVPVSSGEVVQLAFTDTIVSDTLLVPTKAILQKGDSHYVFTAENGKAVKHIIEIVNSQTEYTAVKGDLREGEALIVNGHKLVSDGMNVLLPGQDLPNATNREQNGNAKREEGQRKQGTGRQSEGAKP